MVWSWSVDFGGGDREGIYADEREGRFIGDREREGVPLMPWMPM